MLKHLFIENFTVFEKAQVNYFPHIDVAFSQELGAGTSHLLLLGYTVTSFLASYICRKIPSKNVIEREIAQSLVDIFKADRLANLISRDVEDDSPVCFIHAKWGQHGSLAFDFSSRRSSKVNLQTFQYETPPASSIFLPSKEILSVFPGFQAALENREFAFPRFYLDLSKALNPSPLRQEKLTAPIQDIIKFLQNLIHGTIIKKDEQFFFVGRYDKRPLEAMLMGESRCKLGTILYLLQNGELAEGSTFYWDEPDAGFSRSTLELIARLLYKMSRVIHVVIATHSLDLLVEIKQEFKNDNFRKDDFFHTVSIFGEYE